MDGRVQNASESRYRFQSGFLQPSPPARVRNCSTALDAVGYTPMNRGVMVTKMVSKLLLLSNLSSLTCPELVGMTVRKDPLRWEHSRNQTLSREGRYVVRLWWAFGLGISLTVARQCRNCPQIGRTRLSPCFSRTTTVQPANWICSCLEVHGSIKARHMSTHVHGGKVTTNLRAAQQAQRKEAICCRRRRRFRREPEGEILSYD